MRNIIRVLLLIVAGMYCASCSSSTPDKNGFVEFTIEGKTYRTDEINLQVHVDPTAEEMQVVKTIPRGEEQKFEFYFMSPKPPRKGIMVLAYWAYQTSDPDQALLSGEISTATSKDFMFDIHVPSWRIDGRTCWVKIDEIRNDRVIGSFGGPVKMYQSNNSMEDFQKEISDGRFDVPYKKFYRYQ